MWYEQLTNYSHLRTKLGTVEPFSSFHMNWLHVGGGWGEARVPYLSRLRYQSCLAITNCNAQYVSTTSRTINARRNTYKRRTSRRNCSKLGCFLSISLSLSLSLVSLLFSPYLLAVKYLFRHTNKKNYKQIYTSERRGETFLNARICGRSLKTSAK